MKIINLIENTDGFKGCAFEHGLSFYVETENHKLLMDVGPSESTISNASILGIDLDKVDLVVLSHGHYDHSGGIMPFAKVNDHAPIYMQSLAIGNYYADDGEGAEDGRYKYIGIDPDIAKLPQVRFIDGDHVIDDELELITIKNRTHELPSTNKELIIKTGDGYIPDEFRHEHFLVIKEGDQKILMSGCAHNGILSILDAFKEKYGVYPDAVISGFHLMVHREYTADELEEVRGIARELKNYPSKYFTCHCTGVPAYEEMKKILGDQLQYVHSGDTVKL